ncbi:DHA2 family efflux MFS transporter permease subunit [Cyanobium sp. ATX 6F1]|uniref:DHA2 family efflux MFS transporter permease subunit n=1 Tax=Cyanobium sp. ATX 6F1 TaxID=2823702 RepID=UPI0020CC08D1|nr:DHA2 family efflux MFS transporter permease subunit [Cyanobium sp. ATX 6F1]MCP9915662.1 DHA2 family efflux MFS transporter permease subunit [Cyanobium sp. ATX 6F1]
MASSLANSLAAAPGKTPLTPAVWLIIATASLGAFLEVLDTSIVNVALTSIQANLGATLAEVGWVVTGYAIANVVILPLTAFLADGFGRRSYFVFSLAGFTAASVLCGLAPNLPVLVASRILQGLLGGGLLAKAQAILFEAVPKDRQGFAQAIFGLGIITGPALGPTFGGYLTDLLGWRWIFLINLPFGILAVLMALRSLPADEPKPPPALASVDWIGIALLTGVMASLQVVLEQGEQYAWFEDTGIVALTLTFVIALPLFIAWELSRERPAVDLRVLRHRSLAVGSLFSMIVGLGLYGTVFLIPIYAQSVLHITAIQTGLLVLPGALASGATMLVLSKKVQQIDPRKAIAAGSLITSLVMFALASINPGTGEDALFWPLIFRGIGTVLMFLPLSLAALGDLPPEEINAGSGFYNLTRQLGGSFGIALLTSQLSHHEAQHRARLTEAAGALDIGLRERLEQLQLVLQQQGVDPELAARRALKLVDTSINGQAALLAYGDVFHLLALVFLAAIPLVLLLRAPRRLQP